MKTSILISITILLMSFNLSAQQAIKYDFCQVTARASVAGAFLGAQFARIDKREYLTQTVRGPGHMTDADGNRIRFNSVAEIITLMQELGWEHADLYPSGENNDSVNIIFRRQATESKRSYYDQ
jgi:hypothetical protein